MNVEDSYEGAVRRLQRLERAGIAMDATPPDVGVGAALDGSAERMRELEELASLACEDNERLKSELGVTLRALDERGQELVAARAELGRAQQELATARREIEGLRAYVAGLQASAARVEPVLAASPPQPFAAPNTAYASAFTTSASATAAPPASPSPFADAAPFPEALPDEDYGLVSKSRNKAIVYLFILAIGGAIIAALGVTRPWAPSYPPPAPVEWHVPAPVTTAPSPAPQVQPTVEKMGAAAAKVEPIAPRATSAPASAPASSRSERKHARHSADKNSSATAHEAAPDASDDPLAGTNL